MEYTPKITVIVPIYNVEPYLRQCLDSIVHQTVRNLQIILVDDGSPDGCGIICDEYAANDDRIIVIHKQNAGVSEARNDGLEVATGEWIMFVDPDDWLELDCCMRVLEAAENSENDIIYFQREIDDESGEGGKRIIRFPNIDSFQLSEKEIQEMRLGSYIGKSEIFGFQSLVPWAKIYRLKFLRDNACSFPIGLKKSQDVVFNLSCQEHLRAAFYLNYVGYHNRINNSSVCNQYNVEILDITFQFLNELKKLITKFHADENDYIKAMGVRVYNTLSDAEYLYLFYPQKVISFKKYIHFMHIYYQNEIVSQYMRACKMPDFFKFKQKIRYFFISRHWLLPYYCIQRGYALLKEKSRVNLRIGRSEIPGGGLYVFPQRVIICSYSCFFRRAECVSQG